MNRSTKYIVAMAVAGLCAGFASAEETSWDKNPHTGLKASLGKQGQAIAVVAGAAVPAPGRIGNASLASLGENLTMEIKNLPVPAGVRRIYFIAGKPYYNWDDAFNAIKTLPIPGQERADGWNFQSGWLCVYLPITNYDRQVNTIYRPRVAIADDGSPEYFDPGRPDRPYIQFSGTNVHTVSDFDKFGGGFVVLRPDTWALDELEQAAAREEARRREEREFEAMSKSLTADIIKGKGATLSALMYGPDPIGKLNEIKTRLVEKNEALAKQLAAEKDADKAQVILDQEREIMHRVSVVQNFISRLTGRS